MRAYGMLVRPQMALVMLALMGPAHALSPEGSRAVLEAIRTGEIVGAAAACRAPDDRLIGVGRKVIHGIRAMAKSEAELERARVRHEQAVQRGAAKAKARQITCEAALAALMELEREPSPS